MWVSSGEVSVMTGKKVVLVALSANRTMPGLSSSHSV